MSLLNWFRGTDDEPRLSPEFKRRLDALEESNRRVEKALSALELDWSEWFNKFRLLYARLTKRVQDEEKRSLDDAPRSTNGERSERDDELVHHRLAPPLHRQRKNY